MKINKIKNKFLIQEKNGIFTLNIQAYYTKYEFHRKEEKKNTVKTVSCTINRLTALYQKTEKCSLRRNFKKLKYCLMIKEEKHTLKE